MTDRTKLIIAVTAGLIGLALAIFATIVAVNARDKAESDASVQQQVSQQVDEALRTQARKEARRISRTERFVQSLSGSERKAVREISRLRRSVRALKVEVASIEADQADEFSRANGRISNLSTQVSSLTRRVKRLENELNLDGGASP